MFEEKKKMRLKMPGNEWTCKRPMAKSFFFRKRDLGENQVLTLLLWFKKALILQSDLESFSDQHMAPKPKTTHGLIRMALRFEVIP